ncbi:MAG: PepSY domain-containing protein [Actinomycetota bacterium]
MAATMEPEVVTAAVPDPDLVALAEKSARWRTVWRVHFYSGILSMPFMLMMALTGLMILYVQPYRELTQKDLRIVSVGPATVSYDQMEQAVEKAYPGVKVVSMTMPYKASASTIFGLGNGREAFVNQYSGKVLGDDDPTGGIAGVSRRLHGTLNNTQRMISLPTVSALWDDGPVMRDYVIGDLVLEIFGGWALVLAVSGVYLWWPRKWNGSGAGRRRLFRIRWKKAGRARWRDMHAVPGALLCGVLLITLVSGMGWSTYWAQNFTSLANEISPNVWTDTPSSSKVTRGDLDRIGNSIPWNTGTAAVPNSYGLPTDGSVAQPVSLNLIARIGHEEGMKPGYSVYFPDNSQKDDAGNPLSGSFVLSNSWPRKTYEARDVFVDQFTGKTLGGRDAYGYGSVSYFMDSLVSVHMGTQFGWSIAS